MTEPYLRRPRLVQHGVDCWKVPHSEGHVGYLHGPYDDGPYEVDGVMYCGRCHLFVEEVRDEPA